MCYFDLDEPAAEYNIGRHEAAGAWSCEVCGAEIPPGGWCRTDEMLQEYADPDEGATADDDWETFEVCFACDDVMTRFQDEHGSVAAPSWFAEALRGCFEGASKTDADAKVWRDDYAGILRRGRAQGRMDRLPPGGGKRSGVDTAGETT